MSRIGVTLKMMHRSKITLVHTVKRASYAGELHMRKDKDGRFTLVHWMDCQEQHIMFSAFDVEAVELTKYGDKVYVGWWEMVDPVP